MSAAHWIDRAFQEWGRTSEFTEGGLHHLDAMRQGALSAQVKDVLDLVNTCEVSAAEWAEYRAAVEQATSGWAEDVITWGAAGQDRVGVRAAAGPLTDCTRNRYQVLLFVALTNGRCGKHDLTRRELTDD